MTEPIAGALTISENVIADIAGYAAMESYGIVGMASPTLTDGIAKLLPANRLRKGISVTHNEDASIKVDLFVIVEYGINIAEASRMLSERVTFVLTDSAGQKVQSVQVHVQGVKISESRK